jgi:hypothetical protein
MFEGCCHAGANLTASDTRALPYLLQVRGTDAIKTFSQNLVVPYQPPQRAAGEDDAAAPAAAAAAAPASGGSNSLLEEMRRQVEAQAARIAELEAQLKAAAAGGGSR